MGDMAFSCKHCGSTTADVIEVDVGAKVHFIVSAVTEEDGVCLRDPECHDGTVHHYQCSECTGQLEDQLGTVITSPEALRKALQYQPPEDMPEETMTSIIERLHRINVAKSHPKGGWNIPSRFLQQLRAVKNTTHSYPARQTVAMIAMNIHQTTGQIEMVDIVLAIAENFETYHQSMADAYDLAYPDEYWLARDELKLPNYYEAIDEILKHGYADKNRDDKAFRGLM